MIIYLLKFFKKAAKVQLDIQIYGSSFEANGRRLQPMVLLRKRHLMAVNDIQKPIQTLPFEHPINLRAGQKHRKRWRQKKNIAKNLIKKFDQKQYRQVKYCYKGNDIFSEIIFWKFPVFFIKGSKNVGVSSADIYRANQNAIEGGKTQFSQKLFRGNICFNS